MYRVHCKCRISLRLHLSKKKGSKFKITSYPNNFLVQWAGPCQNQSFCFGWEVSGLHFPFPLSRGEQTFSQVLLYPIYHPRLDSNFSKLLVNLGIPPGLHVIAMSRNLTNTKLRDNVTTNLGQFTIKYLMILNVFKRYFRTHLSLHFHLIVFKLP